MYTYFSFWSVLFLDSNGLKTYIGLFLVSHRSLFGIYPSLLDPWKSLVTSLFPYLKSGVRTYIGLFLVSHRSLFGVYTSFHSMWKSMLTFFFSYFKPCASPGTYVSTGSKSSSYFCFLYHIGVSFNIFVIPQIWCERIYCMAARTSRSLREILKSQLASQCAAQNHCRADFSRISKSLPRVYSSASKVIQHFE